MGFWRAGPMLFRGRFSVVHHRHRRFHELRREDRGFRSQSPGMTGVDSTGAGVTTSCFGTLTTRTRTS